MLGIPDRGTKIEANSWNSVPNRSAEEKTLGIPFYGTKIEANIRNFVPKQFRGNEKCSEFRTVEQKRIKLSEFRP
jgi:hypothetical protein